MKFAIKQLELESKQKKRLNSLLNRLSVPYITIERPNRGIKLFNKQNSIDMILAHIRSSIKLSDRIKSDYCLFLSKIYLVSSGEEIVQKPKKKPTMSQKIEEYFKSKEQL